VRVDHTALHNVSTDQDAVSKSRDEVGSTGRLQLKLTFRRIQEQLHMRSDGQHVGDFLGLACLPGLLHQDAGLGGVVACLGEGLEVLGQLEGGRVERRDLGGRGEEVAIARTAESAPHLTRCAIERLRRRRCLDVCVSHLPNHGSQLGLLVERIRPHLGFHLPDFLHGQCPEYLIGLDPRPILLLHDSSLPLSSYSRPLPCACPAPCPGAGGSTRCESPGPTRIVGSGDT
jgi:hypothetical protein